MQGVVRIYDPLSGEGLVRPGDRPRRARLRPERARAARSSETLRQGQRINFELDADGRAVNVRIGSEVDMGLPTAQV